MGADDCPQCGHSWSLHPGSSPTLNVCGECVYEEDYGQREWADMCVLATPDELLTPAGVRFTARVTRSWRGRYRVVVEDGSGFRWITLKAGGDGPRAAEQLLAHIQEDLAVLPPGAFGKKYG